MFVKYKYKGGASKNTDGKTASLIWYKGRKKYKFTTTTTN